MLERITWIGVLFFGCFLQNQIEYRVSALSFFMSACTLGFARTTEGHLKDIDWHIKASRERLCFFSAEFLEGHVKGFLLTSFRFCPSETHGA